LVFTAGVGEHAGQVREAVCAGLELDGAANATGRPDAEVARHGSRGRILVVATREDVTMLEEVPGAGPKGRCVAVSDPQPAA
jgi:acetate kinase